ncbi:DUF2892 domain-containing protein [Thiomonas sp. X19]|uniref:YgaP family membrane protein n=1 Tax=Thiomonas sp. X19 TaxID=1050370 RepID=UPI00352A29F3
MSISYSANRFGVLASLRFRGPSSNANLSKEIDMFYVKNVPTWERVLRVVMGLMALGFAAIHWGGSPVAIGAGVMGAVLSMTGLFGFCPMCAMVGRKLDKGA